MAKVSLSRAYQLSGNAFWPTLAAGQVIPTAQRSAHAQANKPMRVGMGVVLALVSLLRTDRVRRFVFVPGAGEWRLVLASSTNHSVEYDLGGARDAWWVHHASYLTAVVALVDALTVARADPVGDEVRSRWASLLAALRYSLRTPPPYDEPQLALAATNQACQDAMMAAVDSLYHYAVHLRAPGLAACHESGAPSTQAVIGQVDNRDRWLYGVARTARASAGAAARAAARAARSSPGVGGPRVVDVSPRAMLLRVIRRGGTALLNGSTGIGKSQLVREATLEAGAALVAVTGMPGLEDRDLFGGVYERATPDGQRSFGWIDGPLAEAWRAASGGRRVVLQVDELARFDPYNLAPLLGGLDRVEGAVLRATIGLDPRERDRLDSARLYRVLRMRNGETLVAPVELLSIIATANQGRDYVQLQAEFDAALLRRFELQIDLAELDIDVRRGILERQHGLPTVVVDCLLACHDWTVLNTAAHNGLLRRTLNLAKVIDWAVLASDLVSDGASWRDAVPLAAESTIIGYCCAREDDGTLERAAADMVRTIVLNQVAALPA